MTHESVYRVYHEDVDLAGIVYYANYFKFIERARTELLRKRGITHTGMSDQHGLGFVVSKVTAHYFSPLRFEDLARVQTEITKLTKVRIEMNQIIRTDQSKRFEVKVTIACMDLKGKVAKMPDDILARLQQGAVNK